jgi:RNA polymerase-binding protein DksA
MSKEKTNKTYLAPAEIKKFKMILLAKRTEILSNVTCMEDETLRKPKTDLSHMPIHMADVGTDNYEVENTLGLMDSERKLIEQIDNSLERIEDGTYGICEGNGEAIPIERLEAIPWARYCVACARLLEKGLLNKEELSKSSDYDYETGGGQAEDTEQFYERIEKP